MKKTNILNIFLMLLVLFWGVQCIEEKPNDPLWAAWFFCIGSASSGSNSVVLEDQSDGTVKETVTKISTHPCFIPSNTTTITYIKKCVQGQVYRSVENDCQGTGSAGTNWGATTFQYCPTNDVACETSSVANSSSPAQATCFADTTAGRNWKLMPSFKFYFSDGINRLPYFPEILISPNYFWTRNSYSIDMASLYKYTTSGIASSGSRDSKTSLNFVQCGSYE